MLLVPTTLMMLMMLMMMNNSFAATNQMRNSERHPIILLAATRYMPTHSGAGQQTAKQRNGDNHSNVEHTQQQLKHANYVCCRVMSCHMAQPMAGVSMALVLEFD